MSGMRAALGAAWPICLGYFPLGLALGILGRQVGFGPFEIGLMSIMVFAGSAQFIAVGLLAEGASAGTIILTTFVINFRHFLMSSALSVYLAGAGQRFLAFFAYGITDESFAVNLPPLRQGAWTPRQALIVNQTANTAWVLSTVLGATVGGLIPVGAFGIDYALIAMFLCLLIFQLRGGVFVTTAAIGGGLAVLFTVGGVGDWAVVGASIMAATLGFAMRRWRTFRQEKA